MKKMIFSLCALLACFVFSACSDYASKVTDIAENIKSAEKAEDFVEILKESAQLTVDFYKSNPSDEEVKAFNEAGKKVEEAFKNLDDSKKKAFGEAMQKLMKDEDFKKLAEEAEKAETDYEKAKKDEKKDE